MTYNKQKQSNGLNKNIVKSGILNLSQTRLDTSTINLLNLGPNFAPSFKKLPYMEILTPIESFALHLEKKSKKSDAEKIRQNVSKILIKNIKHRLPDNLSKEQRLSLNNLKKKMNGLAVYPFDKGTGFVLINEEDAFYKLEEEIKHSVTINYDPTQTLMTKFQKLLCRLRKQKKLDNKTYFQMYPSDCVPPRLYGVIKAHKPEKNYPMRPVVSTIGTPPYGSSEHLVKIIQPTLNKNKTRLLNSSSFVNEAKSWLIDPSEIQVSFDVVALYPSIPIDRAIPVIIDILNNDIDNLKKRTKLTLSDIHEMIELCLNQCYFLYKNEIRSIPNSGPIGLSLMVVVAEAFLQHLEAKALIIAEVGQFSPKTYRRYVDDSHARFDSIQNHDKFLELLNEQDPTIKYTSEKENNKKELNFLDITVTNTNNSYYNFKIHRKSAITNIQIKPTSNVNPKIVMGVFKGFLSRAVKICSKKYLDDEIQFLINMFAENGHDRLKLETTAKNYIQKRINLSKINYNKTETFKYTVKLPWLPRIGPKLRKELKPYNVRIIFTTPPTLKNILCNNKSKLIPNSNPGVYKLTCSCGSIYIGETKKKILTRCIEHQKNYLKGKWDASGATEHGRECNGMFDWSNPKTLAIKSEYDQRKVRESLEINYASTYQEIKNAPILLNRDNGIKISTNSWRPLFQKIIQKKESNNIC
ncbi:uncharacterized protein LOC136088337 [Hydra vulgaris]|uniref:Uncharacterized protein LOC136088333 n=2 Tax=Hydra vulgaris TaxID=6087 RepID=A0ABM4D1K1_HYDVU